MIYAFWSCNAAAERKWLINSCSISNTCGRFHASSDPFRNNCGQKFFFAFLIVVSINQSQIQFLHIMLQNWYLGNEVVIYGNKNGFHCF